MGTNEELTFRDRVRRLENTLVHIMKPELSDISRTRGIKNIMELVEIQKRNADVTAPSEIAETTREYTQALKNLAHLHLRCHFDENAARFNKLRSDAVAKSFRMRPVLYAYLDEHFPQETPS